MNQSEAGRNRMWLSKGLQLASIEEPELIERILAHRRERGDEEAPTASLGARAPPQASLF